MSTYLTSDSLGWDPTKEGFDYARHLRLITYAFFLSGPQFHIVYSKILPVIAPCCTFKAALKKVAFT